MPCVARCVLMVVGLLAAGCAVPANRGGLVDFKVLSRGQDESGDFCRDFNFTSAQAAWFFGRAKVLTPERQHESLRRSEHQLRSNHA